MSSCYQKPNGMGGKTGILGRLKAPEMEFSACELRTQAAMKHNSIRKQRASVPAAMGAPALPWHPITYGLPPNVKPAELHPYD